MYKQFTVIIPTLNEEKNIGQVLDIITKMYPGIHTIVSDDGSRDKTKQIVLKYKKKNTIFLDRSKQKVKGLTASIVDGILNTKTEYFVVMDGDLQHPPEKIKEIASALDHGEDIVVGVRRKVLVPWPWHRRMMSKSATLAGNIRLIIHNVHCKDIMSGFFGMNTKKAVEIIKRNKKSFQMHGYKVLFDILKNMRNAYTFSIYYDFGLRSKGKSKLGSKVIYHYFRSLFS